MYASIFIHGAIALAEGRLKFYLNCTIANTFMCADCQLLTHGEF